jgi:hypothetical protein
MSYFDKFNDWINNTEGSIVNTLTAIVPWIAPLAPAYMTLEHMLNFLGFNFFISLMMAVMVEVLGFATISTGLDFWFYNRRERANNKKAPFWLIVSIFGFYLVLVLTINVVIDISVQFLSEYYQSWAVIAVRALLTLQTVPGALIVAARTGHRDLLSEIKKEKMESSGKAVEREKKVPEQVESSMESSRKVPADWRKLRPTLTDGDVSKLAHSTPAQMRSMAEQTGYTYKTISNWRMRARHELGLIDSESSKGVENE